MALIGNFGSFSKILEPADNIYTFNPSIAHWKDDLYLCTYRKFIRYPKIFQNKEDYDDNPEYNPNHPWMGGAGSIFWWKKIHGYDKTGIVLLKIERKSKKSKLSVVKRYPDIRGVDARLIKLSDNLFSASFNIFITDKKLNLKDSASCGDWCGPIATRLLTMGSGGSMKQGKETVLCPEISGKVEKNWAFWVNGENLFFSYGLYPSHDVYKLQIKNNTVSCEINGSPEHYKTSSGFFKKFHNYYKSKHNITIHISVSTPTIKLNDGEFLGIGHIKYDHSKLLECKDKPVSPLHKFTCAMMKEGKNFHPKLIYLMFFYTFDNKGIISRLSDMFLPPGKTALSFPSGLTRTNNDKSLLISYGDADASCNIFFINEEDLVKDVLHPIKTLDPSKLVFEML